MQYSKKQNKGFTLIELLVVISIIALLSSVILSSVQKSREKAAIARIQESAKQIHIALELYRNDHGEYPGGNNTEGPLSYFISTYLSPYLAGTPVINDDNIQSFQFYSLNQEPYYYARTINPVFNLKCGEGGLPTNFVSSAENLPYIIFLIAEPDIPTTEIGYYAPDKYFKRGWISGRDAYPGHWSYCL